MKRADQGLGDAGKVAPARLRYRRSHPGMPRGTLKRSQRERLIGAMTELSAQSGYHAVGITELCSSAGVSPVTFYQYFPSKEDCFLAAYLACGEEVFATTRTLAGATSDIWQAARLALENLLIGLESDPDAGRLLFIEALGAGPAIHEARERVLAEFQRGTQALVSGAARDVEGIDVPTMAVIGALRHIISRYLRINAEDQLPALLEDGLSWLASYAVPPAAAPRTTSPPALLDGAPQAPQPPTWAPEPLPPGTHGLSAGVIARSQRTRLIYATAEVMMNKGYQHGKISDIVAAARVARPVFYEHFSGKEHAFLEAQAHPTQYILDSCAEAYFSADEWPQRIWRMLGTLTELIASNPALSHLRLVECYAAGPTAIRRAEEITRSFTIFLHEGYRYRSAAAALPRLRSQAVAGAIFEIIQRLAAAGDWTEMPRHLPQLVYVAIAPFAGAKRAIDIVEELKVQERTSGRAKGRKRGDAEAIPAVVGVR
jgi:AcrR family transcriptional regulator